MKVNLIIHFIVLQGRQKYYGKNTSTIQGKLYWIIKLVLPPVKMKKKKLSPNSKEENLAPKKSKGQAKLTAKKDKDFGGIPDIDPKIFLGCGHNKFLWAIMAILEFL